MFSGRHRPRLDLAIAIAKIGGIPAEEIPEMLAHCKKQREGWKYIPVFGQLKTPLPREGPAKSKPVKTCKKGATPQQGVNSATIDSFSEEVTDKSKTILVIDEQYFCELLEEELNIEGFNVLTTINPHNALRVINNTTNLVDLIITDINTYVKDEITFLYKIRKKWPIIPVILHSIMEWFGYPDLAFDRYINKSIDMNNLVMCVNDLLNISSQDNDDSCENLPSPVKVAMRMIRAYKRFNCIELAIERRYITGSNWLMVMCQDEITSLGSGYLGDLIYLILEKENPAAFSETKISKTITDLYNCIKVNAPEEMGSILPLLKDADQF